MTSKVYKSAAMSGAKSNLSSQVRSFQYKLLSTVNLSLVQLPNEISQVCRDDIAKLPCLQMIF